MEDNNESFALQVLKTLKEELQSVKKEYKVLKNICIYMIVLNVVLSIGFIWSMVDSIVIRNDIGTIEETIDIDEVEKVDNSTIKIGDELWEKSK